MSAEDVKSENHDSPRRDGTSRSPSPRKERDSPEPTRPSAAADMEEETFLAVGVTEGDWKSACTDRLDAFEKDMISVHINAQNVSKSMKRIEDELYDIK